MWYTVYHPLIGGKEVKKVRLGVYGAVTLLLALYVFVESVNLSPFYSEGAIFWALVISLYLLIWALFHFGEFTFQRLEAGMSGAQRPFNYVPKRKFPKVVKFIIAAPWAFLAVMMIISSPLISWGAYRDQLGEVQEREFSSDIQAVDMSQVPIVDQELAYNLANKKLGEKPSLGSQVVLGEPDHPDGGRQADLGGAAAAFRLLQVADQHVGQRGVHHRFGHQRQRRQLCGGP